MGVLAEIGESLVVVHGQSDQIRLKGAAAQREALDKFAGETWPTLAGYQDLYGSWKSSQAELDSLRSAARERLREAESLEAALAEIDAVDPQPGEDEALKAEAVKLANVEELRIAATTAHQALIAEDFGEAGDATTLVDAAKRTLEHVAEHDEELGPRPPALAEVGFLLNDIATELASYQAGLDSEGPERLAEIEERRAHWPSWSASTRRASTRSWNGRRTPGPGSMNCRTTPPGSKPWTPRWPGPRQS